MRERSQLQSESDSIAPGRTVLWAAVLELDERSVDCVITNISAEGAVVSLPKPAVCGESLQLSNERLGSLRAEVIWQNGTRLQLRFNEDTEAVALKVAEAMLFG